MPEAQNQEQACPVLDGVHEGRLRTDCCVRHHGGGGVTGDHSQVITVKERGGELFGVDSRRHWGSWTTL